MDVTLLEVGGELRKCDNLLHGGEGVREFVMFSINKLFFEIFDKI